MAVDRVDISKVGEAAEGPGDVRGITLREERRPPDVEGLANDRRVLEELPVGGEELVEASADRRLYGDGKRRARGSACPCQLDDEERMPLSPADVDIPSPCRSRERAGRDLIERLQLEEQAVVTRPQQGHAWELRPRGRKDHQPEAGRQR